MTLLLMDVTAVTTTQKENNTKVLVFKIDELQSTLFYIEANAKFC